MSIRVEGLFKTLAATRILDDVTFDVPDGGVVALLGPSGSGKTTVLRIIAGLAAPDAGRVLLGGADVGALPPQERNVGCVFQHYALFKHMTVAENVAFGLDVRKRPRDEVAARVGELLSLVQLEAYGERYPAQLSGGQRQRVALARALAPAPRVLLLDEPFGALDAQVRRELREWLRKLHDEMHVTSLIVTHDQEEALDVAHRVVVMQAGRIEQIGTPDEVYDHPATPFVARFVGAANIVQGPTESYVRPHDVRLYRTLAEGAGLLAADVERLVRIGWSVRVHLRLYDGQPLVVQLTRERARELRLAEGLRVYADLAQAQVFQTDYVI